MRRAFITWLVLILAFTVIVNGERIEVEVKGISPEKGEVVIGVYEPGDFPEPGEEMKGARLEVKDASLTHTFQDISPGAYAVSLFHDKNENGKLDKNFLGIPQEGYGFSNNVFNWYGAAPEFDKASVKLGRGDVLGLTIEVKTWPPQI